MESTLDEILTFVLKNTNPIEQIPVKVLGHFQLNNHDIRTLNSLTLNDARAFAKTKGWTIIVLKEE